MPTDTAKYIVQCDDNVTPSSPAETPSKGEPTGEEARGSPALRVTAAILEALKNGVRPWTQPWDSATALALPVRHNGAPYRASNIVVLWCAAQARGYRARTWMGFHQARELGGVVRRGERGTSITYYSPARVDSTDAANEAPSTRRRAVLRTFTVFNVEQIEGLPARFHAESAPAADCDEQALATLFQKVPACIEHGGSRACYNPATDTIYLPPRKAFESTSLYFSTLLHELAHWSGHATRLDRDFAGPRSAAAYAREELVAELSAAFLGAELGLPASHLEDHASYIDVWLKTLAHDPSALLVAAGKAQAAADYLRNLLALPTAQGDI